MVMIKANQPFPRHGHERSFARHGQALGESVNADPNPPDAEPEDVEAEAAPEAPVKKAAAKKAAAKK